MTTRASISHTLASQYANTTAVFLQIAGATATLISSLLVTRSFGIEAQGSFSLIKSWTDAIATLLMLGLPQVFLHLSFENRNLVPGLIRFAWKFSFLCTLFTIIISTILANSGNLVFLIYPLLASSAYVLHGQFRALLLRTGGILYYAIATSIPALSLLTILILMVIYKNQNWGLALTVSALISALGAIVLIKHSGEKWKGETYALPSNLWKTNSHGLVQNFAAAFQTALLLFLLKAAGAPATSLGELALAMVFLQVFGAVAGIVAPIIYQRAAINDLRINSIMLASVVFLTILVLGLASLVMPMILELWLPIHQPPSEYLQRASVLMAGSGVLVLSNRIVGTVLQARGAFGKLTGQAIFRLLSSVGLTWIGWSLNYSVVDSAAFSLFFTEFCIYVWTAKIIENSKNKPITKI